MTENVFLAATFFPCVAAVIVFFMKYVSSILQARVRLGQDEAYRAIAEKAAASQAATVAALADLRLVVSDIQLRLGVVQQILKDVE